MVVDRAYMPPLPPGDGDTPAASPHGSLCSSREAGTTAVVIRLRRWRPHPGDRLLMGTAASGRSPLRRVRRTGGRAGARRPGGCDVVVEDGHPVDEPGLPGHLN